MGVLPVPRDDDIWVDTSACLVLVEWACDTCDSRKGYCLGNNNGPSTRNKSPRRYSNMVCRSW
jgi:hypothetical protein